MPFALSNPVMRQLKPIEIQSIGSSDNAIPSWAKGFEYWLIGAGGNGGAGGSSIGGGGGAAGQLASGRVILSELVELFGSSQIVIEFNLGISGEDSQLIIKSTLASPQSEIVLATARCGYSGLPGMSFHGFGFGDRGTTFTAIGGIGEIAQRKEYQGSTDRNSTALNRCGDGGNGGAAGMLGLSGQPGWGSIEFF